MKAESQTGSMWLQSQGSQVTTASSLSLLAVSCNIYSHRGFLNPDDNIHPSALSVQMDCQAEAPTRPVRHLTTTSASVGLD